MGEFYEITALTQWTQTHKGGVIGVHIFPLDTRTADISGNQSLGDLDFTMCPKSHQRFVEKNLCLEGWNSSQVERLQRLYLQSEIS